MLNSNIISLKNSGAPIRLEGATFRPSLPSGGNSIEDKDNMWTKHIIARNGLFNLANASFCIETPCENGHVIRSSARGGNNYTVIPSDMRDSALGYRPVLIPTDEAGETIKDSFIAIPNGTKIRMYSLLMDGKPVCLKSDFPIDEVDIAWNGASITYELGSTLAFSDEYFGDEYLIPWVVIDGALVCSQNLLYNISWGDLRRNELVGKM